MKIINVFFCANFLLCLRYDLFRSPITLSFKIKCLMYCYTYVGIDDQDTFNLEMKGFLQELQCPYLTLTKSIDSLNHHDNRLLLLNYLLSELQTSRLLMEKEEQDVAMVICLEIEVHRCIATSFKMDFNSCTHKFGFLMPQSQFSKTHFITVLLSVTLLILL